MGATQFAKANCAPGGDEAISFSTKPCEGLSRELNSMGQNLRKAFETKLMEL